MGGVFLPQCVDEVSDGFRRLVQPGGIELAILGGVSHGLNQVWQLRGACD
jgi:hypothetical protein